MSYLVLARKWRPKRFAELVGQEHVVRALTNALESDRVHHAYLFTGTRGVGKTTIARIFAKSLNCERGTGSDPCGECETCLAIDAGRYIDLLEIDAASNTGVDNVRELIDNAQYMPSRGRHKVYLIDEVHMLSKPAFNALLKTLEEPPEHVKFLFATTDPEKLLVTVLSRCLQFNLKRLDLAQIEGQITKILAAEEIIADTGAVRQLAKAADGSLRDGLSLLDQAIAYTGGSLTDAAVATMLGTVDRTRVGQVLAALASGDGEALLREVAELAEFSPDWSGVLDALADALHRAQIRQLVPGSEIESDGVDLDALATALKPEVVQLWYQMALNGRRDLHLAPSPRAGFEMSVLRMLAFRPVEGGVKTVVAKSEGPSKASGAAAAKAARDALDADAGKRASAPVAKPDLPDRIVAPQSPVSKPGATETASTSAPPASIQGHGDAQDVPRVAADAAATENHVAEPEASGHRPDANFAIDGERWFDLVANLALRGPARELAAHAGFVSCSGTLLLLSLPESDEHLKAPFLVSQFADALGTALGTVPQIRFEIGKAVETVHTRTVRARDTQQSAAEQSFLADPDVQRLMSQHGAKLVPDSIRPYEE